MGNPYAQAIEHDEKTAIGKALADGWEITHVATAIAGDYLLSTFVLDKPAPHTAENYI